MKVESYEAKGLGGITEREKLCSLEIETSE